MAYGPSSTLSVSWTRWPSSSEPFANSRVQEAALTIIAQVRHRAYTAFQDFRHDLTAYLEAVHSMHQTLPNLTEAAGVD